MCGIAGFNWADKELIKRMCDAISHRGPDDSGFYVDKNMSLGNRRLSIIDISNKGHQPMYNENNSVVVVFNGEIWNYKELRKELESKKHKFRSDSDTEVLVHGYEEYEEGLFKKLDGMFALAIWDIRKRKLILGRDRMGKKPLYIYKKGGVFLFGSEIKSFLQYKEFKPEIDLQCLSDYLGLRFSPDGRTMFLNVFKVMPGEYIVLSRNILKREKYWNIPEFKERNKGDKNKVDNLIDNAVEKRLMSDVPVGVFLSGGLDSSALVCYMKRHMKDIRTFSVGFGDVTDETSYAKIIAEKFKTKHKEIKLNQDILSILPKVVWHFDEPLADPAALPTFLLCQEVGKEVKVALSGEGGDEVFGGYHTFNFVKHVEAFHSLPYWIRRYILSPAFEISSGLFKYPKKQMLLLASSIAKEKEMKEAYKHLFYLPFTPKEKEKLLKNKDIKIKTIFDELFERDQDLQNCALKYYFKEWLPNNLLMKADKMSMASSLEVRTPFLDKDLIEYFSGLNNDEKKNRKLFREVVKNYLPEEVMKKKKQGFTLPLTNWFQNKEIVNKMMPHFQDLKKRGLFNEEEFDKIMNKPLEFRNDHKLWVLLNLELWCKMYLDGKSWREIKI